MRLITRTDYRQMPWKNAAGTTHEITIYPASANTSDAGFIWRMSIADVTVDAPFSRFPGYDRLIMLLDGNGMTLESGTLGTLSLDKPLQPMALPGELPVTAKLKGGPCRDLNVMTQRTKARARLSVHRIAGAPLAVSGDSEAMLAYAVTGAITAGGVRAGEGDTLIREGRGDRVEIAAPDGAATIALVEIVLPG
jgi:environmental stress-induced protein Ves